MHGGTTFYERLGVDRAADATTLRAAYRTKAKEHHPDLSPSEVSGAPLATAVKSSPQRVDRMAALNEAWAVLSDPDRRAAYDRSLQNAAAHPPASGPTGSTATTTSYTPEPPRFARKEAWLAGLRVQIARLTRDAVGSAAWALSLKRHGRPRGVYLAQLDPIIHHVIKDTSERIKTARAAGSAPLDLGLATALVGLGDLAERIRLDCRVAGPTPSQEILAEVIDKAWDHLAHEISHEVEVALGGNPHLAKALLHR